ncbi:MAG: type II toxin-antitoxin system PemK/MazF family toxin [Verrucomicrobia bacterium]|nr:type II toxin-antitoxin system PemK/MazF family toxin [Verrucomicrobiota bacterium]
MPKAQRGEIWQVDFGLAAKVRPAVIYSVPFLDHERALFAVIPHTTALRGTRFEVSLTLRNLEPGAFDVQNLGAISQARLLRQLGKLIPDQMADIDRVVKAVSSVWWAETAPQSPMH